MRRSWLRSKRQQALGSGCRHPPRALLLMIALFWWSFGAEALHTVNAKTAGRILPSLPCGDFLARVVFAEMKVLHPIALAVDRFARLRWNRF
jgi:hypothetical protein